MQSPAPDDASAQDENQHSSWRQRLRQNPRTRPWYRAGVAVAGGLCMLLAALTGWLPGPGGIPLFLAGLALWATEFEWAHAMLARCRQAFETMASLPVWQRRLGVAVALLLVLGTWWGLAAVQGLPGWLPQWLAGWVDQLPGVEAE